MSRRRGQPDKKLGKQIADFCRHIAGSSQIAAACIVGDYTLCERDPKKVLELLLVVHDFQPRLMNYIKVLGSKTIIFLAVDQWVFERDVDKGFLGEALAGKIIFPYVAIANEDYLHFQEVKLKKRLILELLETLVLDFPELSYNFHIKPEYFLYETLMSRTRLFPPMIHNVLSFFQEDVKNRNVKLAMHGYLKALKELEKEETIELSDGYVKFTKSFVEMIESKKYRFVNLFKTAQRTLFASLLGAFSKTLSFLSENRGRFPKFHKDTGENSEVIHQLEDPLRYLFIPTAHGLVPLSNEMDIVAFARKMLSRGEEAEIEIGKIGGVLNDVYLIKAFVNGKEKRIVVKRFKDWSSFKWFPLNLWTLGTTTFAVSARSRLDKECAINQFLYDEGFDVPRILHVSHVKRLVFQEYIEGNKLNKTIRHVLKPKNDDDLESSLNIINMVGEKFAEIHLLGIALGDTKPENIMVRRKNKEICLLDLEQASRNGDKVWDIAEFLYYTGHYISPLAGTRPAELITKAFVGGYLKAGGDIKLVEKASNPKYTKVFSIFTLPHVILTISNICGKASELKRQSVDNRHSST